MEIEVKQMPIFPLDVVLFPGAILPLHIFEDRYKAMMRYALERDNLFGLSYREDAAVGKETVPEIGSVGCIARINAVMPLEGGRMNILSRGIIRYRIIRYSQTSPFLIAEVETFGDDPEGGLEELCDRARGIAERFFKSIRRLSDAVMSAGIEFPEDPEEFSLIMASALPIENASKQELLEMTSTGLRLARIERILVEALSEYSGRLRLHELAKTNGRSNSL
jgi:Lon protease-like protein